MDETYRRIIVTLIGWLEDEHMGLGDETRKWIKETFGIDVNEWEEES